MSIVDTPGSTTGLTNKAEPENENQKLDWLFYGISTLFQVI